MAIPTLAVELIANSTPLVQAIDICKAKVLELRKKLEAGDLTTDVFQKLVDDLKVAQASLGYFQQKYDEFGKKIKQTNSTISDSSGRAALGIQGFTRVIQDAPYGFIGIANNLQELPNAFAQLRKSAELTGKSLTSTILSSLNGPAGLGLALSAITTATTFAVYGFDAWTRGFGKTKSEIDKTKEKIDSLTESIKGVPNIRIEAEAQGEAELTKVNSLIKVISDTSKSYEEQKRAKDDLIAVNESYFGWLEKEEVNYQKLKKSAEEYTNAIVAQAIVKGIEKDIETVSEKYRQQSKTVTELKDKIKSLTGEFNNLFPDKFSSLIDRFKYYSSLELFGKSSRAKKNNINAVTEDLKLADEEAQNTFYQLQGLKDEYLNALEAKLKFKSTDKPDKTLTGLQDTIDNIKKKIKDLYEKAKDEGFELPPIKLADNKEELKQQFEELTKIYKKYQQQFKDFNKLLEINETFTGKTRDTRIEELKKELQELKPVIEDIFKEKDKLINSNQSDDNLGFRINFETNFREQLANYKKLQNDLLVLTQERLLKQRDAEIQSAVKSVSLTDRTLREIIEINERADRGILLSPTIEDIDQWNTWRDATIRAALEASGEVSELFINTLEQINKAYATETIKLKVELQVIAPKNVFSGLEANKNSIVNNQKGDAQFSSVLPEINKNLKKDTKDAQKESEYAIKEFWGSIARVTEDGKVDFNETFANSLTDVIDTFAKAFQSNGNIGLALAAAAESVVHIIGSIIKELGKQIIIAAELIDKMKKALPAIIKNPLAAVAIGGLMIVVGSVLQNAVFSKKIPAFADGGVVMGPTLGLIGEAGKEAVIPLDRLGEVVGNVGGKQNVFVTGEINGEMIYLQQQRAVRRRGRLN